MLNKFLMRWMAITGLVVADVDSEIFLFNCFYSEIFACSCCNRLLLLGFWWNKEKIVSFKEDFYIKWFYHLITNDEDSIRQVDSGSPGKRDLLAVDASSDCHPSCSSLDRDSRRMDLDVYILENKNL